MSDENPTFEAMTQEQFCDYCQAVSRTFDTALTKHGPHAALNICAGLLGYAVFKVAKPDRLEEVVTEVAVQAVAFGGDLRDAQEAGRTLVQ